MQGVCDTSGDQILMSETKYIIQAAYLFGKDKIQLWISCLALEEQKKKRQLKADCADPLWPFDVSWGELCDQVGWGSE